MAAKIKCIIAVFLLGDFIAKGQNAPTWRKALMSPIQPALLPTPDIRKGSRPRDLDFMASASRQEYANSKIASKRKTGATGLPSPSNKITMYKVEGEQCYQSTIDGKRKWLYLKSHGYKAGKCKSQGFAKPGSVEVTSIPLCGENEMLCFLEGEKENIIWLTYKALTSMADNAKANQEAAAKAAAERRETKRLEQEAVAKAAVEKLEAQKLEEEAAAKASAEEVAARAAEQERWRGVLKERLMRLKAEEEAAATAKAVEETLAKAAATEAAKARLAAEAKSKAQEEAAAAVAKAKAEEEAAAAAAKAKADEEAAAKRRVTLYKIDADQCYQSTTDGKRKWTFFTSQGYKAGDCYSQGFTEPNGSQMTSVPFTGENEVFSFRKDAGTRATEKTAAKANAVAKTKVAKEKVAAKPKRFVTVYRVRGEQCEESKAVVDSSWLWVATRVRGFREGNCLSQGFTVLDASQGSTITCFKRPAQLMQISPDNPTLVDFTRLGGLFAMITMSFALLRFYRGASNFYDMPLLIASSPADT